MRLKIQKSLIVLFLIGLFLYGCVDEPYIEPVKRPFSVIKVGNFTSNLDPLTVMIDGKTIGNLTANTVTKYFDVKSGQRTFTIKDANGNTVYNKDIPVISYEEEIILFTGYYSTTDTLNTFGFFSTTEGYTYVEETPPADSAQVYFINCVTDTPVEIAKKITASVDTVKNSVKDTLYVSSALAYGKRIGTTLRVGTYDFGFMSEDSVHAKVDSFKINNQKKYYFFIGGTPKNITITTDEENPLPARSK